MESVKIKIISEVSFLYIHREGIPVLFLGSHPVKIFKYKTYVKLKVALKHIIKDLAKIILIEFNIKLENTNFQKTIRNIYSPF